MFTQIKSEWVQLLNGLEPSTLSPLLTRVFQRINDRKATLFSSEEEEKLQSVLGIHEEGKVKLIVATLEAMIEEVVYQLVKPKLLEKELNSLGLEEARVALFVAVWLEEAEAVNARLVKDSYGMAPQRLTQVNWKLKLESSKQSKSHLKRPLAQLDLRLESDAGDRNVSLEFSHQQLLRLYNELEDIQTQVDILQK